MNRLLAIILAVSGATLSFSGAITGTVVARGPDQAQAAGGGKYESRKFKFVEKIDYAQIKDFIVYIDQPVTNSPAIPPRTLQVITQRDAVFRPRLLPVMVGTTVEWPNKDDIYHNVFSISESNPFDLGLYKDPEVKKVKFERAGRVDVFCSIHSQMNCIILVLPNPFFAATDKMGRFKIDKVPAGAYKLKAWHERLPGEIKEVVVPESGQVEINFTLGIKGLPKY